MAIPSLDAIATIISRLGESSFETDLISFIKNEVDFDSSLIIAYPGEGKLQVVYDALQAKDREVFNSEYREGLWAMSPLYLKACSGYRGAFHISDLAPDNFEGSVFFQQYWCKAGITDQFAYIAQLSDSTPLALSLERSTALSSYSDKDIQTLKSSSELIIALLERHWRSGVRTEQSSQHLLRQSPDKLLDIFSGAELTPREKDVLELLVMGLSNKLIGRELGISYQTVKVYCKNINVKLDVAGRSEIYGRIVKSLLHREPGSL